MTEETFIELCEHLSGNVWLQGLFVTVGTCFLEDVARCGVGLMVAAGHVGWWLAFGCMTIGGMAGDLGLYLIGRYATFFLMRRHWVDLSRLKWMETYFANHAAKTVFLSRFIPGARTLAFSAAGIIRYPLPRFAFLLFLAAVVQSLLYLQLGAFIGDKILPYLTDVWTQLGVVGVILLGGYITHLLLTRRNKRRLAMLARGEETP